MLAVSGGRDSMALMHAVARVAPESARLVATFDHGTGVAATRASDLAAAEAGRLGFPVVVGRALAHPADGGASEAAWRSERLAFLRDVARGVSADIGRPVLIATAHTRDDQVETVLMRVLRHAGARGLAGLYARGEVARPLLECARAEVAAYAESVGADWVDDPTNDSMRYFRNRVRRDLLPALARVRPGLDDDLLSLARGAADWRDRVDAIASAISRVDDATGAVSVAADQLEGYSRAELSVLWPAIAARAGHLLVKLPPAVDAGEIPFAGVERVSLDGEAKEARAGTGVLAIPGARRALLLPAGVVVQGEDRKSVV